jgi:hypothetical protein
MPRRRHGGVDDGSSDPGATGTRLIRVTIDEGVSPLIETTGEIISLRAITVPTNDTTIGFEVPRHPGLQHPTNEVWFGVYSASTGLITFTVRASRCYVFDPDRFSKFPSAFRITANNSDLIEVELEVREVYVGIIGSDFEEIDVRG